MATVHFHRWVLLLALTIDAASSHAAPGVAYRTATNEVRLSFSAFDRNNHAAPTLQASDIAVVDRGVVVRSFRSFVRSGETNLEVAIVIDDSGSVAPRFYQELSGALGLIAETGPLAERNVSVVSFQGQQPTLLCAGDCRTANAFTEHLAAPRRGSLTPLFDTIIFAANFLARRADSNAARVLILFSDGEDTISRKSLNDAIDAVQSAEIEIHAIDLNGIASGSQGGAVLRRLASSTGGGYFPARTGAHDAMNSILAGLRATYTVSYQLPSPSPGFHSVRILPTHNLNLEFRSRSGYYYPTGAR